MPKYARIIISIACLLFGAQAWAQPADLPTPEELLREARFAHGWTSPHEVGTIEAKAHVTVGEREYDTVVRGMVGADSLGDATFTMTTSDGTVTYGQTGADMWFEGKDGNRQALPPLMQAFVRGHQFHRRVLFPELELAEIDREVMIVDFDDHRAFKITGTTPVGSTLAYYFDEHSKKMLGFHLTVQEAEGPHPMDFYLRDWRTSAGQSLFWQIEIDDRGTRYVYRYSQILLLP